MFSPDSVATGAFDGVYSAEVTENLIKDTSRAALSEFERVATHAVVVTTPNEEGEEESSANSDPYMEHKYEWTATALGLLGYPVDGLGARWPRPDSLVRRGPPVRQLAVLASELVGVVVGYRPLTSARPLDAGAQRSASSWWFPLLAPDRRHRYGGTTGSAGSQTVTSLRP